MAGNKQSGIRWSGLVFLGKGFKDKPVYTLLTKTQIVEIIEPRTIELIEPAIGCICGRCDYERETLPVVDFGIYCGEPSLDMQRNNAAKQWVVLRTTRLDNSGSRKLILCSSRSVQTLRLSVEQQKKIVDDRAAMPAALADTEIVRGFFTLSKNHIVVFDFDKIAREAESVIMKPAVS